MTSPFRTSSPLRGPLIIVLAVTVAASGCTSTGHRASAPTTSASRATVKSTTTTAPEPRASNGCGVRPAVSALTSDAPGDVPLTFRDGGVDRSYRLSVPDSYDEHDPVQLILNLHGSGSNALQASTYSDLPRKAARRGAIVVAPDAINGLWQIQPDGTDDDFLVALVDEVTSHYCVDRDDIHVIGMSLGAWKATAVGCRHRDIFASMALVAEEVRSATCPPTPVIAFHGTGDHVVPYGDGADPGVVVTNSNAGLPGARSNIADWANAGGCATEHTTKVLGNDVELWTYPGCDDGIEVQLYTIRGGDHTWPGSEIVLAPTTRTIDATEPALDFFDTHPLRTADRGPA